MYRHIIFHLLFLIKLFLSYLFNFILKMLCLSIHFNISYIFKALRSRFHSLLSVLKCEFYTSFEFS